MTQASKQLGKVFGAQGQSVAERDGESHTPGCFTVRAPRPRRTVSGIPGHDHMHPHNRIEAPRQLCGHQACSATGQDWSGAGVTVVSSDLYAHVGRCWELPDAGASGIGDTVAAPVPSSCSVQGPQGQAATYIEQSMH